jgi:PPOX class probable F420-dependent enzyme
MSSQVSSVRMSRRDLIRMTDAEQADFLDAARTAALSVIGPDGYPHTTGMWYAVIDGILHFATYAKSQKVRNLERNPKCAVLVEDGDRYENLRGVMIQGDAEIVYDPEFAGDVMVAMTEGYWKIDVSTADAATLQTIRDRAKKRAVIKIHPRRVASWDHRKLGGTY